VKRALSTAILLVPFLGACGDCGGKGAPRVEPAASATASAPEGAAVPTTSATVAEEAPATAEPILDRESPALTEAQADALVKSGAIAVELLAQGEEPRRPLRHRAKAGARVRVAFDYEVAMVQTSQGQDPSSRPVPALVLESTMLRVARDGKAGWTVTLDGAKATPEGDVEKLLAEEVAPLLKTLAGKSTTWLTDERASVPLEGARPEGLEREALQIWSSLEEAVQDLAVPVPADAKWRVHSRLRRAGIAYVRSTEFELGTGKGVSIKGTFKEQPIATRARDPLMPEGMNVAATGGSGAGKLVLELDDELVVVRSDVSLDSTTAIAIEGPPGVPAMRTQLRLRQHVKGARQ
jgi:hypothetical protein